MNLFNFVAKDVNGKIYNDLDIDADGNGIVRNNNLFRVGYLNNGFTLYLSTNKYDKNNNLILVGSKAKIIENYKQIKGKIIFDGENFYFEYYNLLNGVLTHNNLTSELANELEII